MLDELRELLSLGVLTRAVIAVSELASSDKRKQHALQSPQRANDVELHAGRISLALLDEAMPKSRLVSVFLCGPPAMMAWTRSALAQLQLPSAFLHEESFSF